MQPLDIISIGSAVLDVIMHSSSFLPKTVGGEAMLCEIYGGKANVEHARLVSGGAGTNTAVSFARQGYRSGVIAEVGFDVPAQIILDDLRREGVTTQLLVEEDGEETGVSVVLVADDASRSALTYRGAAKLLSHSDIPWELIKKTRWIHLSSLGGNTDLCTEILLFCRKEEISVSWNPSAGEIQEMLFRSGTSFANLCEAIFLNDQEFESVVRKERELRNLTKYLFITRGKEGGEVLATDRKIRYHARPVKAVCEIGAGDAFASGVVGGLLNNTSIDRAIEQGLQNATNVVKYYGAKEGLLSTFV